MCDRKQNIVGGYLAPLFVILIGISLMLYACNKSKPKVPSPPTAPIETHAKVGVAPYAIQHPNFACDEFIASIKDLKAFNLSFLWHTFGEDNKCLLKVMIDPRLRLLQIHLMNEVCVRNKNCGDYEVLHGLTNQQIEYKINSNDQRFKHKIVAYAQNAANFLSEFKRPDLECIISPGLESNLTSNALNTIVSWLKSVFPWCSFSVNPLAYTKTKLSPLAEYTEHHYYNKSLDTPCIFNNDGYSIIFPEWGSLYPRNFHADEIPVIYNKFSGCKSIFFWHHAYNCINPRRFIDPRSRKCDETLPFKLLGDRLAEL